MAKKITLQEKLEKRKIKKPGFIYWLLGGIWKILFLKKYNVHYKFNINVKKDGDYAIKLHYALPSSSANVAFKIEYDEEGYLCAQRLEPSKKYKSIYANNIAYLKAGEHQIFVTGLRGEWCLDYIEVVEVNDKIRKTVLPEPVLNNKKATKEIGRASCRERVCHEV